MEFLPAYVRHVYSGFEPAHAFDVVQGGHFEHRLLSSQSATMKHQRLTLGDIRLESGCYDFPVIAQGHMPKEAICIGLMAEGGEVTRLNTAFIGADEIQIYPSGVALLYHATGCSRWITLTLPKERLQTAFVARTGRELDIAGYAVSSVYLRPGGRHALKRAADEAMSAVRRLQSSGELSPPQALEISNGVLGAFLDALCHAQTRRVEKGLSVEQRHYFLIRACERRVLSGIETEVALSEIARRSGYTLRSLQMIFHSRVGMTPGRWFMTARLNGALRDLLQCNVTHAVSDVALKWGFRHMSRFSGYYRKAFGELPRDTLCRPRIAS
jgi:AraC-like DNA-binding protein